MQRLLKEQLQEHTETVKTRPPSSALLGIDSANRFQTLQQASSLLTAQTPNVSPYNFNLYAPTNFIQGFFTRIAVAEINFPWAVPNINDFSNQIYFNYATGGGPANQFLIQIPIGWYDFAEIAAAVESAVVTATADATFTCKYNNSFVYEAESSVASAKMWFSPYYEQGFENQKGLFEMMAWNVDNLAGASNSVFSGAPTCLFTNYIDVVCNNLTAVQDVRDGSSSNRPRDALCRLYLTDGLNQVTTLGSEPFNVLRQFTNPKYIKWENNIPVASLSFQVYNDCGYELSATLPNTEFDYSAPAVVYPHELPDWQMSVLMSEQ